MFFSTLYILILVTIHFDIKRHYIFIISIAYVDFASGRSVEKFIRVLPAFQNRQMGANHHNKWIPYGIRQKLGLSSKYTS